MREKPAEVPRWGAAEVLTRLWRAGDVSGRVPDTVEPAIAPVVTVEDLTQPEFWWLRRGGMFSGNVAQGAVAGQQGYATFFNTLANVIAIIDEIVVSSTGAAFDVQFGFGAVPGPATAVNIITTDARGLTPAGASVAGFSLQSGTAAAPVIPTAAQLIAVPAAATGLYLRIPGPIIVRDNANFNIVNVTANLAIRAMFRWRERPILLSER